MRGLRSVRIQQIREVQLFRGCNDKQLKRIAGLTTPCSVSPGAVLCNEGAVGRETFIIVSGQAQVTIDGYPFATLQSGDIAGEMAVLDGARRTATVIAQTAMTVLVLNPQELATVLDEFPQVAKGFLTTLSRRLRQADQSLGLPVQP